MHDTNALDALIAALPTPLALPLRDYQRETHPVLQLWAACDALEILLRLLVFVGIGELARGGALPEGLRRNLRDAIEIPTLGRWRRMAEQVGAALPADTVMPELYPTVREVLAPLLDGPNDAPTPETAVLALRNRLAHGGGLSQQVAARLRARWTAAFDALWPRLAWLTDLTLVARAPSGGYYQLRGTEDPPTVYIPPPETDLAAALATAFAAGEAVVAVRAGHCLPLWPLALYGVPRGPDPDQAAAPDDPPVPQVYVRYGEARLEYTPLGETSLALSISDEVALERFRVLFHPAPTAAARGAAGHTVSGFEGELRQDARRLVGRVADRARLSQAIADGEGGLLWVEGVAGIGKSYLMARIAIDCLDAVRAGPATPPTLVLAYRFRAADPRCNRQTFLRFALERLAAWPPLARSHATADAPDPADQKPLDRLRDLLAQPHGGRVLFLLDGLDEIAELDSGFVAKVPLALKAAGATWVCAGRPERGLRERFAAAGAVRVFPDGLPPLEKGDLRTLLLERIGPLRKNLLRQDREDGERIDNEFIAKVARLADGLPLYVKYVIDDIHAGRYRVFDAGERLPPGLAAYHEELLRRCSLSSLQQVLTPLVATLAVAREPLTPAVLADLLYRCGCLVPAGAEGARLVDRALTASATLLRRAVTPEGAEGYELYHHSLAQHLAESARTCDAVATARDSLADLAHPIPAGAAAPYLYRHGLAHRRETGRVREALVALTDFAYLIDRLRTLGDPAGVEGLGEDWRATLHHVGPLDREQRLWEAFWREREHILRRGDDRWPAYKILLQLAVEHADDSPATRQAEIWLEEGHCDWVWLRNPQRIKQAAPDPCLRVLEGHTDQVEGALELRDGRILSWSEDHTLRLWDGSSGAPLAVLEGHTGSIRGVLALADGRLLSWSEDHTLRLWDGQSGAPLAVLEGHTGPVWGALTLPEGHLLSWSSDHTLRLWDGQTGAPLAVLEGHWGSVAGVRILPDGRLLSWSHDKTLRLWDGQSGAPLAVLEGHWGMIGGVLALPDGRLLSWSKEPSFSEHTLRLWDGQSGAPLAVLEGHTGPVWGALTLPEGHLLSWSSDHTLRLWDGQTGAPLAVLEGHTGSWYAPVRVLTLPDGHLLSWSEDKTLRLWDGQSGAPLAVLEGHADAVSGALALPDGCLLSWSSDHTLRLWDGQTGAPLAVLEGHADAVRGALALPDGRLLSWSSDHTLRLWDGQTGAPLAVLEGHWGSVAGVRILPDGRLLSWSEKFPFLRLWDGRTGAPLAVLERRTGTIRGVLTLSDGRLLSWFEEFPFLRLWDGRTGEPLTVLDSPDWHSRTVAGVGILPDGRLLSWSEDHTLRLWDEHLSAPLAVLEGHTGSIRGVLALADGRLLSWSDDHTLRLWDEHLSAPLAVLEGHTGSVAGALALADGRLLSWSYDHTLRLWDGASGAPLAILERVSVRLLTDGPLLIAYEDGYVRLWDGQSGAPLAVLEGHTGGPVWGALTLPDGRLLSRSDFTLRLWDSQTGQALGELIAINGDLPWRHPDLLWHWRKNKSPNCIVERSLGWAFRGTAILAADTMDLPPVCWQATSKVQAHALNAEGILAVTLDSGHVFFLQLYRGNRRISIAEYEYPAALQPASSRACWSTPLLFDCDDLEPNRTVQSKLNESLPFEMKPIQLETMTERLHKSSSLRAKVWLFFESAYRRFWNFIVGERAKNIINSEELDLASACLDVKDLLNIIETRLDLASGYLDVGDQIGARRLLEEMEEIMQKGSTVQKERAAELLKRLG